MNDRLDPSHLSDDALLQKLTQHGLNLGPLTSTTRVVFENKLRKVLNYPEPKNETCQNGSVKNLRRRSLGADEDSNKSSPANEDSPQNSQIIYYGVALAPGVAYCDDDEPPLVFTDKKEALRAVKKYKGARFKATHNKDDAVVFANQSSEQFNSPLSNQNAHETDGANVVVGEKPSVFKGPKSQDTVKLRKAIECGDAEYFQQTVWSNPRYLVSSGDTPSVLQEGFRYNALHVAAKSKQPAMMQLVLDVISDQRFMQLLYPDDNENIRQQRIAFLTDLYLNTPDKGMCETPLHFACKFGCAKAVEILLSYPACDRNRVNKYGQMARDIICDRSVGSGTELKEQIEALFEDRYFVPVLRSEDNAIPPAIGQPFTPDKKETFFDFSTPKSPKELHRTIMAAIGPISPLQATDVYRKWKTPERILSRRLYNVRLSDPDKGIERIGRDLAKKYKYPWKEYWAFLKTWCDLSSADGIMKLDTHLRKMHSKLLASKEEVPKKLETSLDTTVSTEESLSPVSQLCKTLEGLRFSGSNRSHLTSPDTPSLFCRASKSHSADSSDLSDSRGSLKDIAKVLHYEKSPAYKKSDTKLGIVHSSGNTDSKKQFKSHCHSKISSERSNTFHEPVYGACHIIVDKLSSILCEITLNQLDGVAQEVYVRKQLTDQLLFELTDLQKAVSRSRDIDRRQLHGDISREVFKDVSQGTVFHEQRQLRFLLLACLTGSSPPSSDDEREEYVQRHHFKRRSSHEAQRALVNARQHLRCILQYLCNFLSKPDPQNVSETCYCAWLSSSPKSHAGHCQESKRLSDGSLEGGKHEREFRRHNSSDNIARNSSGSVMCGGRTGCFNSSGYSGVEDVDGDIEDEVFYTPPSSRGSSTPSEVHTPDEGIEVYMLGSSPTKVDVDVLRAIESITVDPVLYPHVWQWKQLVQSFPNGVAERWPSPASVRTRRPFLSDLNSSTTYSSPGPPVSPLASVHSSAPRSKSVSTLSTVMPRNLYRSFAKAEIEESASPK